MKEKVLCGIYDCIVQTKRENWPDVIKAIDKYLDEEVIKTDFNGGREFLIPNIYCLKEVLDMICSMSNDDERNTVHVFEAIDMYLIYMKQTPEGLRKGELFAKLCKIESQHDVMGKMYNLRNNLITAINGGDLKRLDIIYESTVIEHTNAWNRVDKDYLPKVGEPVIVLTVNGCVGVDWVNEPDGDVPFAHYHVVGWLPISGGHIEVNKK